jgi:hypothetical protein
MNRLCTSTTLTLTLFASALAIAAEPVNQPPKGFTTLFNGQDLAGWKGGSTADPRKITPEQQAKWDADIPAHWRVENGEIVNDGHEPHLVTEIDYGDFELWVDWKLSPKGDSGLYLRGCPQVQLWDPTNVDAHEHGSDKGSGALWNNQKHERFPTEVADKPIGQWNRMHIKMIGERVTVVLNEKKVVDNEVLENYYDRKIPVFKKGPIHLQTHGSETRFRNLFIREIPADEATQAILKSSRDETGFEPLLNGKDLTGWIGATDAYEVVEGELRAKPGAHGALLTEEEYDNFIVRMEFQLPPGGNNGLAIRTPKDTTDPSSDGIEIQVLDDAPEHYPDLKPYQAHGSVYGLAPAARGYVRPAGEWNYQETVVDGDHIQVTVNGFKVTDVDLAKVRKEPMDGQKHPGASRKSGHIGFSGHNDPVRFRNVRIKRLTGG